MPVQSLVRCAIPVVVVLVVLVAMAFIASTELGRSRVAPARSLTVHTTVTTVLTFEGSQAR